MIDRNTRIIIEAIRKARRITLKLDDDGSTMVVLGGDAPRTIAIALQHYFDKSKANN